jgi:hypothetical protein
MVIKCVEQRNNCEAVRGKCLKVETTRTEIKRVPILREKHHLYRLKGRMES